MYFDSKKVQFKGFFHVWLMGSRKRFRFQKGAIQSKIELAGTIALGYFDSKKVQFKAEFKVSSTEIEMYFDSKKVQFKVVMGKP